MKRRILIQLAGLLFAILIPSQILAVPANPDINPMQQPDGSVFDARLQGDEWNNWIETRDGFTIDRAPDGTWRHVTGFDGNTPRLGASRADKPAPANLKKHLHLDVTPPMNLPGNSSGAPVAPQSAPQGAPFGNFNGPVLFILAEFSNRAGTYSESSWGSFISNNVNDFFSEASYGKVNLTPATETSGVNNNGVIGWVNLGYNHPNTGSSTGTANQQITRDAILAADPFINFASYDTNSDGFVDSDELAVVVIVAGYERAYSSAYSPSVWGHKWSIGFFVGAPTVDGVTVGDFHSGEGGYAQFGEIHRSSSSNQHQATMGIMVHELGHLIFGLPDLYDTDGSSSGIGAFGVMGGGSWGKANADPWSGQTPVLPCAWTKLELGWVDQIEGNGAESFTAAGDPGAGPANSVRRASTQVSTQYFLVENRRPVGYDLGLQRWLGTNFGGLAIWHIDDTKSSNSNDANRWVDLEEADGTQMGTGRGSPTDIWYQGNAITFNDGTNPNSKLYSGASSNVDINTISAAGTVMTAIFGSVAPGTLDVSPATDLVSSGNEGGPFTPSFIDYTLTNTGGVSINYSVTKSEAWLDVSNASGSLGPGANTTVTVSLNAGANSLTAGAYGDTVTFTNTTNGNGNTTRDVDLTVNAPGVVNAANDFDDDDDSDLLMVDGSGNIVGGILENSVAQSFGFLLQANPAAGWTVNATGDTSGDGKKDLLLYNTTTGEYRVVTLDGASVLTDNVLFTIDPLAGLEPRGMGDFDGNSEDEIILYQPGTGFVAFVYLAGGAFSSFEIVTQIDEANDWTLAGAADFTGDGKTDLLIQNTVTGETAVIELNGSTPVATTVFTLDPLLGLTIEDTADFTGDGKTDILMLHTSGALAVIEMDGLTFQSLYVPGGLAPNWQLVNAGFYDGDDKADFLFHDPTTGEVITGIQDGTTVAGYNTVLDLGPGSGWTFHKGKP